MDVISRQKRFRPFQKAVAHEKLGRNERSPRRQRNNPRGAQVCYKNKAPTKAYYRKRNVDLTKIPELNENGEQTVTNLPVPETPKDDNSDREFHIWCLMF